MPFFERKRLQGPSRQIAAGSSQTPREIIGNLNRYVHVFCFGLTQLRYPSNVNFAVGALKSIVVI